MTLKNKWKQYGTSIKVSSPNSILRAIIQTKMNCATHCMDYIISQSVFERSYRKYRRGKNRCRYCGVKLGGGINETKG